MCVQYRSIVFWLGFDFRRCSICSLFWTRPNSRHFCTRHNLHVLDCFGLFWIHLRLLRFLRHSVLNACWVSWASMSFNPRLVMSRELAAWYDGTRRRLSHWDRIRGAKLEQLLWLGHRLRMKNRFPMFSLQDPSSMFQTGFYFTDVILIWFKYDTLTCINK